MIAYPLLEIWELKVILSIQTWSNTCQDEKLAKRWDCYGLCDWVVHISKVFLIMIAKASEESWSTLYLNKGIWGMLYFFWKTKRYWKNCSLEVILRTVEKLLWNMSAKKKCESQHLVVRVLRKFCVAKTPLISDYCWKWVLFLCTNIKIKQKFWWGKYQFENQFKNM